jgi:hypothetical protein
VFSVTCDDGIGHHFARPLSDSFDRPGPFPHLRHSFALRLPNAKERHRCHRGHPDSEVLTLEMHHYVANPEKCRLQRLALTGEKRGITRRFYYFDAFLCPRQ